MNTSPKLTGQRSLCAACRETFRSVAGFDRHRVGKHGVDRRCRTVAEMLDKGMSRNAAGDWITGTRPPAPRPRRRVAFT